MGNTSVRLANWTRAGLGWILAAIGTVLVCLLIGLIVRLVIGTIRGEPGGMGLGWVILVPIGVCAGLAMACLLTARRLLRRTWSPGRTAVQPRREPSPKGPPASMVIILPALVCALMGVWISSASFTLSIGAHPVSAGAGGLVGLLLGLGLCLDSRSVQRRLTERADGLARQADAAPQPVGAAGRPSESFAAAMLAVPVIAGAMIWQRDFFHLTAHAVFLVAAAAIVSTAVLGYVDARQLLLRSPQAGGPDDRRSMQPLTTFCLVLFLWVLGYVAHFVARRRFGARNLIAPALAATAIFVAPALMGWFSGPVLPSVDSPEVLSLVERAIAENSPAYRERRDQIGKLKVRDPVELSFDAERQKRVARASLVSALGEETIFYTVEWQQDKRGTLIVRVYEKQP